MCPGALGAATGGTLGVIRNQSPVVLSVNMGINLTVASLAFYSTREYIVSPLLLSSGATASHVRRMEALSEKQRGKLPESVAGPGSYGQIRVERVLDSGLAGALNAGTLSGLFRESRRLLQQYVLPRRALDSYQYRRSSNDCACRIHRRVDHHGASVRSERGACYSLEAISSKTGATRSCFPTDIILARGRSGGRTPRRRG